MKIRIEKLIYEGFGLGHELENGSFGEQKNSANKKIFVRKSVPGDELEVEILKEKKNYAEAITKRIINPSDKRVNPICSYFEKCGGCEHMNISYKDQLKFKDQIFKETLKRAKIDLFPEPIIPGSNFEYFYRNSIRFFFVKDKSGISFARHNYIYNKGLTKVEKCFLQSETANEILINLKKIINEKVENKALLWQLKIREGKFTEEFMVEIITTGNELPGEKHIVEVLKNLPNIKSIYHTVAPGKSLKNLRRRLIYGSPIIYEKIGRYKFQISPESFFQTNSLGVHTLYEKIKEFAKVGPGDNLLDLYCGTGSIGIYLSTLAKKVIGVEIVPEAIRDAKDNAKINNVQNCDFFCANASDVKNLKLKNISFDIVIVDPPRAGLSEQLIAEISKWKMRNLIYVSCNPATFARDLKIFKELGFSIKRIQPIDMFPQTHHIECIGLLEK